MATLARSFKQQSSDFYKACEKNDIPTVRQYLRTLTPLQINKIEPNGSTALHVACYHNHAGLVKLLIEHGASASIQDTIDGLTPYQLTTCNYIKQILSGTGNKMWIEWTFVHRPTLEVKQIFDITLKNTYQDKGLPFMLNYLLNHYVHEHVPEMYTKLYNKQASVYSKEVKRQGFCIVYFKNYILIFRTI